MPDVHALISATGIMQQGDPRKIFATMPEPNGKHLWTYVAIFKTANPAREHQDFDTGNLLSIVGPGCFHCEQQWNPTIGSKCPGAPNDSVD